MKKNVRRAVSPDPTDCPCVSEDVFSWVEFWGQRKKEKYSTLRVDVLQKTQSTRIVTKKNSPSESNDNERDLTTIRHESNCPSLRPGPVNPLLHPRPKRIKNRRVQNIRVRLDGAFWRTSAGAPNGSVPRNICSSANSSLAGRFGKNNLSLEGKCCQE